MRLRFLLATASLLAISCSTAFADDVFTLVSGNGKITVNFTAPATPTVAATGLDYFTLSDISVDIDGIANTGDTLYFYTHMPMTPDSGGLAIQEGNTTTYFVDDYGRQLFTGGLTDPTFITGGPFSLRKVGDGTYDNNFKLDIAASSTAVTPEPSSFILLSTGLLGMAGVVRRRFTGSATQSV